MARTPSRWNCSWKSGGGRRGSGERLRTARDDAARFGARPVDPVVTIQIALGAGSPSTPAARREPEAKSMSAGKSRTWSTEPGWPDHVCLALASQIGDQHVHHAPYRSWTSAAPRARKASRTASSWWRRWQPSTADRAKQPRAQAVIHVVVVVGDLIGQVGHLRLQRRPLLPTKRSPTSPSCSACLTEQCLRMPSRVSKHRLRPSKAA